MNNCIKQIEKLKQANDTFSYLLINQNPGNVNWHMQLQDTIIDIVNSYCGNNQEQIEMFCRTIIKKNNERKDN